MHRVIAFLRRPVIVCVLSALPVGLPSHASDNDKWPKTEGRVQVRTVEPLNPSELFSRLTARRQWQQEHISQLSVIRDYTVRNEKGKALAREVVLVEYRSPGTETFTTRSEEGSHYIRSHVFHRLMKFEANKVRTKTDRNSLINPENYTLEVVGRETVDSAECLVVRAVARREELDLFTGTIWINEQSFAIIKIAGELAKSPSFWIKHVRFTRKYLQAGEFWLPSTEQAVSLIRIFGRETLTIDYHDYSINGQKKFPTGHAPESGRSGI
jgi:hypothetical protein